VVLSGGGSLIAGFADMLAQSVGLEVQLAEPFKSINVPGKFDITYLEEVGPVAAVAVGLAIRRIGDR